MEVEKETKSLIQLKKFNNGISQTPSITSTTSSTDKSGKIEISPAYPTNLVNSQIQSSVYRNKPYE